MGNGAASKQASKYPVLSATVTLSGSRSSWRHTEEKMVFVVVVVYHHHRRRFAIYCGALNMMEDVFDINH